MYSRQAIQQLALQSRILSKILTGTWRSVQTVSGIYLKCIYSLDTSAISAFEFFL